METPTGIRTRAARTGKMKLKKLKDLEVEEFIFCEKCGKTLTSEGILNYMLVEGLDEKHIKCIEVNEVREEAIKWVKELDGVCDGTWNVGGLKGFDYEYEGYDSVAICNFIKHFFNLTEKDIK